MAKFKVENSDAIIEAEDQFEAEAFLGLKLIPIDAPKKAKAKTGEAAAE
jgi:hypothetical protein